MYGLPESPDTLTECLSACFNSDNWAPILKSKVNAVKFDKELTEEQKRTQTKDLLREKHTEKSLVGLFDNYDIDTLERMVGSHQYQNILKNSSKDSFNFK